MTSRLGVSGSERSVKSSTDTLATSDETVKFVKGEGESSSPLADVEFNAVLERVTAGLSGAERARMFQVVETAADLPPAILAEIERQGERPENIH
jgi:hypothetical protein